KPAPAAQLGQDVLDVIVEGVAILHRLARPVPGKLASFRAAFAARYGRREVPLLEALDSEVGIGFADGSDSVVSPLLEGLEFPPVDDDGGRQCSASDAILRDKLHEV